MKSDTVAGDALCRRVLPLQFWVSWVGGRLSVPWGIGAGVLRAPVCLLDKVACAVTSAASAQVPVAQGCTLFDVAGLQWQSVPKLLTAAMPSLARSH